MYYHLVLVIKYERKALDDIISKRAKEMFRFIVSNYNITLMELNNDEDHVHILSMDHLNNELSKLLSTYRSVNSRLIRKNRQGFTNNLGMNAFSREATIKVI